MCGIAGIVSSGARDAAAPDAVRRMTERLLHRGPDDAGFHSAEPVHFGMRRLSVIDPEHGAQPVVNEDRSVTAVYNGEIYNFKELRRSLQARGHRLTSHGDSEVIVHLWEEHGLAAFDLLNGMFAIALHDARTGQVVLARDRIGIKPLYWYRDARGLRFASEAGAIFADHSVPRQPDLAALTDYLTHWYTPSPSSAFAGVSKLAPGETLVLDADGSLRLSGFVTDQPAGPAPASVEQAAELVEPVLREAVERQLVADVPVGIFLSGGLDSALIATLAAAQARERLTAFTVGFDAHGSYDETAVAATVAEAAGLDHRTLRFPDDPSSLVRETLELFDEPFGDYSSVPMRFLCREARRDVTVVLSGDGGDEIFAGYPHYLAPGAGAIFRRMPGWSRRMAAALVQRIPSSFERVSWDYMAKRFVRGAGAPPLEAHLLYKAIFFGDERRALLGPRLREHVDRDEMAGMRDQLDSAGAHAGPLVSRLMRLDRATFLLDDNLVKVDRTSMAASLEVRVPLLDRAVVAAGDAVPAALHLAGRRTKAVLREVARRVMPDQVAGLAKRGFTPPMPYWLAGPLRGVLDELLDPTAVADAGLVDPGRVAALVAAHRAGRRECSRELWTLISLHHWWQRQGF